MKLFCQNHFGQQKRLKIHIRGCKWAKYQCNWFLFYPFCIIRAIFNRLNLRLSQKSTHLDTFLKNCALVTFQLFRNWCNAVILSWITECNLKIPRVLCLWPYINCIFDWRRNWNVSRIFMPGTIFKNITMVLQSYYIRKIISTT